MHPVSLRVYPHCSAVKVHTCGSRGCLNQIPPLDTTPYLLRGREEGRVILLLAYQVHIQDYLCCCGREYPNILQKIPELPRVLQ